MTPVAEEDDEDSLYRAELLLRSRRRGRGILYKKTGMEGRWLNYPWRTLPRTGDAYEGRPGDVVGGTCIASTSRKKGPWPRRAEVRGNNGLPFAGEFLKGNFRPPPVRPRKEKKSGLLWDSL